MSTKYKKVFLIAGNHEYYNAQSSMDEINQQIEKVCESLPNVIFLQNSTSELEEYKIIGTTLWSDTTADRFVVAAWINDYNLIRKKEGQKKYLVTPTDTSAMHKEAVSFLIKEVTTAYKDGKKVIVVSHHLPSMKSVAPQFKNSPVNSAFATNLDYLISDPIVLWMHGHSHHAMDYELKGVRVVANPYGYMWEKTGFKADFVCEL
jgi:predicted phosphohydrolase